MIQLYDFGIDVQTYANRGKENAFPSIHRCPHCQAKRILYRHGYYERNALVGQDAYRIWIARYRCAICKKTVTVLPTFLLPYFQYTIGTIVHWLKERLSSLLGKGKGSSKFFPLRQGVDVYMRRFLAHLPWLRCFFKPKGNESLDCPMNHSFKPKSGYKPSRELGWRNLSKRCGGNTRLIF